MEGSAEGPGTSLASWPRRASHTRFSASTTVGLRRSTGGRWPSPGRCGRELRVPRAAARPQAPGRQEDKQGESGPRHEFPWGSLRASLDGELWGSRHRSGSFPPQPCCPQAPVRQLRGQVHAGAAAGARRATLGIGAEVQTLPWGTSDGSSFPSGFNGLRKNPALLFGATCVAAEAMSWSTLFPAPSCCFHPRSASLAGVGCFKRSSPELKLCASQGRLRAAGHPALPWPAKAERIQLTVLGASPASKGCFCALGLCAAELRFLGCLQSGFALALFCFSLSPLFSRLLN